MTIIHPILITREIQRAAWFIIGKLVKLVLTTYRIGFVFVCIWLAPNFPRNREPSSAYIYTQEKVSAAGHLTHSISSHGALRGVFWSSPAFCSTVWAPRLNHGLRKYSNLLEPVANHYCRIYDAPMSRHLSHVQNGTKLPALSSPCLTCSCDSSGI